MDILIVEDEDYAAITLNELLQIYGCICYIAKNCKEAHDLLEHRHVDGIVCDFSLPGENGGEFFLVVQEKWPYLADQFVFLSGSSPEKIRSYVGEHVPIFSKPITMASINQIVAILS